MVLTYFLAHGCLITTVGRALAYHCCILGLIPDVSMLDGYDCQEGQGGSPVSSPNLGKMCFLHQYRSHISNEDGPYRRYTRATCVYHMSDPSTTCI